MRNPDDPEWPAGGERTELEDVADVWRWAYYRLCQDRHRQEMLGAKAGPAFGAKLEEYLAHREHATAPQTYRNDRAALYHMADDFGPSTPVAKLRPQRTLDRLLREGKARTTVRTYSKFLSGFFTWLELPYKVKLPASPKDDVRVWSAEEIGALRDKAEPAGLLLPVDCGLYLGLRLGEIWGLEWSDFRGWTVRVRRQYPSRTLKGKRARTAVILPGWAHEAGEGRVCRQRGMDRQSKKLPGVLKAAGLEVPIRPWHSLRHTYSRMFLEAKPELRLLQASLGHKSVRTTEDLYDHLLPDRAAEIAVEALHG